MTPMKKTLVLAGLAACMLSPSAEAYGPRTTLFVVAGEKKIGLEAPEGMCFLDPTSPLQNAIYHALAAGAERRGDQVMMAAFMDCNNISSPDAWYDAMPNMGFVTWMNPAVGARTDMSRADYLDMREASFIAYAKAAAPGFAVEKKVHRDANTVAVGMTSPEKRPPPERRGTNVLATTLVDQVPIEITVHYDGKPAPTASAIYALMDKLMAQQIALNERK